MEIAPAFQLDPHLRARLHADAVNLARQVRTGPRVFKALLGGCIDVTTVEFVSRAVSIATFVAF